MKEGGIIKLKQSSLLADKHIFFEKKKKLKHKTHIIKNNGVMGHLCD